MLLFSVPKIEIMGESDIYVKTGSPVTLKCVITQSLEEPAYIFWYHDGERVLGYDPAVLDIRMERVRADTTIGTLQIHHARPEDSGNYTCSPSNLDSASVLLHVLNGTLFSFLFPLFCFFSLCATIVFKLKVNILRRCNAVKTPLHRYLAGLTSRWG